MVKYDQHSTSPQNTEVLHLLQTVPDIHQLQTLAKNYLFNVCYLFFFFRHKGSELYWSVLHSIIVPHFYCLP